MIRSVVPLYGSVWRREFGSVMYLVEPCSQSCSNSANKLAGLNDLGIKQTCVDKQSVEYVPYADSMALIDFSPTSLSSGLSRTSVSMWRLMP
jgi:hypothetical protein